MNTVMVDEHRNGSGGESRVRNLGMWMVAAGLAAGWLIAGPARAADTAFLADSIVVAQSLHDEAEEGTLPGQVAAGSRAVLQTAITDAAVVRDDPDATQESVDAAVLALNDAIAAFEAGRVPVPDKAALADAVLSAQALHDAAEEGTHPNQVAAGSKAVLQAAIDAAALVRDDAAADQATVDAALADLAAAVSVFEAGRVPEADKTALNSALALARSLLDGAVEGMDPWQYLPGAKAALEADRASAQAVRDDPGSEQDAVDAATLTLNAAVAAFEEQTTTWAFTVVYQGVNPNPLSYALMNAGASAFPFVCQAGGSGGPAVSPAFGTLQPGAEITLTATLDLVAYEVGIHCFTNRIVFGGGRPDRVLRTTMTVLKADQTLAFAPIPDQVPAATVGLSGQASSGLPVVFQVVSGPAVLQGGTNLILTGLGEVRILATQPGDGNWNPAVPVERVFRVALPPQQAAVVRLSKLQQVYTGSARLVTVATEPAGLAVRVTYNGRAEPPVHAGTYAVAAEIVKAGYVGRAEATLVVDKAEQTLALPQAGVRHEVTSRVGLTAAASSGLPVSVAVLRGPGRIEAGSCLVFSATGLVEVAFTQAGNADWLPVSAVRQYEAVSSAGVSARSLEAVLFKGRSTAIQLAGVSDAGYTLAYTIVTPPAHGTLSGRAPELIYTPSALFAGRDTFSYIVHDGFRSSEPATVSILVRPMPANDFTGSGASSVALYSRAGGEWTIRTLAGHLVTWALTWGGGGYLPVAGDYDGDGMADLMVYWPETGSWFGLSRDARILAWNLPWGGPGFQPVSGDYDGDGIHDLMVYGEASGQWYGWSLARGEILAWGLPWGGPGFQPVSGDYDGDLWADHAVMDRTTGAWFIRSRAGDVLAWQESAVPPAAFGNGGGQRAFVPVAGDYDGDLAADLGVYDPSSGLWYIVTVSGRVLAWAQPWGGPGFRPVSGDFDGDGVYDLAVYDPSASTWYIGALDGRVLAWGLEWGWGGPEVMPVGP
jgi:hypothetical protein